jgi:extradiol dioxygenase family protein
MCDERSIPFAFGPQTLMEGEVGEQQVFMIQDPDENFWEFKCFKDPANLFLKNE